MKLAYILLIVVVTLVTILFVIWQAQNRKKIASRVLPPDIILKTEDLFVGLGDRDEAFRLIEVVRRDTTLNVSPIHLIRCILVLSDGDIAKMRHIIESNYWGDPKNIIHTANEKEGNPDYNGAYPFAT